MYISDRMRCGRGQGMRGPSRYWSRCYHRRSSDRFCWRGCRVRHPSRPFRRCTYPIGCGAAGARECGARVGIGPGVTTVGRAIDFVGPVAESATHLVHSGDVHIARDLVAGDLDVADKGSGHLSLVSPGETVVSGVTDEDALATSEVVPGNVHPVGKGRGWVVVRPTRFSIVTATAVDTEMGPASRVRGIGGLVATEALSAAACVEPDGEPGGVSAIVQNNRVALGTSKGALTT